VTQANPKQPILYIFSGLPGSGKSTLSQIVAHRVNAVYLRIDTLEQALRELCSVDVQGEGYRLSYRIATDNLRVGMSVVADSCNPIELTRREWEQVAWEAQADYVNIEVICSDAQEHRLRVETRLATVAGLRLPTWRDVENREYHDWTVDRIIIDTAKRSVMACVEDLLSALSRLHTSTTRCP
jgi:predicted kinase